MSVSAKRHKWRWPTDYPACSNTCVIPKFYNAKPRFIPLGGTRPGQPGVVLNEKILLVSNVFTASRRRGIPVKRTLEKYQTFLKRVQQKPHLPEMVKVIDVCRCSTVMEYLEGYELLDNTVQYTPQQHRLSCWADYHQPKDAVVVLNTILKVVQKLHERNLIHTDITGFNIFVSPNGKVKILDLFSCIPVEAIGLTWLPLSWRKAMGEYIERRQIEEYLLQPLAERWGTSFHLDWKNYRVSINS